MSSYKFFFVFVCLFVVSTAAFAGFPLKHVSSASISNAAEPVLPAAASASAKDRPFTHSERVFHSLFYPEGGKKKSKLLAALLGLEGVIPFWIMGLGMLYLGYNKRGFLELSGSVALLLAVILYGNIILLPFLLSVYAIIMWCRNLIDLIKILTGDIKPKSGHFEKGKESQ